MEIVDTPNDAPNYREDPKWTGLEVTKCVIVDKGTQEGRPTVDIQLEDKDGKKYVAMATGKIISMIASTVDMIEKRS